VIPLDLAQLGGFNADPLRDLPHREGPIPIEQPLPGGANVPPERHV